MRIWFHFTQVATTLAFLVLGKAYAADANKIKGFTLTEIGVHRYDASADLEFKTTAQIVVDRLYALGIRHINLSPRATMTDPRGTEVVPMTPSNEIESERARYLRLIEYIHGKGMSVGIRPIFFVVDAWGQTPLVETYPNGTTKTWWHGNIQPHNAAAWFESFKNYLAIYLETARLGAVEEFTLGAELASLTVGVGDEWPEHRNGFPANWLDVVGFVRGKVLPSTRVMYDVNYTDAVLFGDSNISDGGELAKWKYRLVDLANPTNPEENNNWRALMQFWNALDAVGVDMYRSLAAWDTETPEDYTELVALLKTSTDNYLLQLDGFFYDIAVAVNKTQPVIIKEIGYRSVDKGFIDPFTYAGSGRLNVDHQAAAYHAFLESFWNSGSQWFSGAVFWDASVDLNRHGPFDLGYSVLGKETTETVIKAYLLD